MKLKVLLPAAVVVLLTQVPAGLCADVAKAKTLSPLQTVERQLKDLSEALHRGRRASADLVSECQRESEIMGGEIDFVGTDIIPIFPSTAEGLGVSQYEPPRPKYINLHMNQLSTVLPLIEDEIKTISAPPPERAESLKPYLDQINTLWTDVQKRYDALGPITANRPYDTDKLVAEAGALNKDLGEIDKLRKDIYKAYKHPADSGK